MTEPKIKVNKLNDLLEEFKEYRFNDEDFQTFIKRTTDDGKPVTE